MRLNKEMDYMRRQAELLQYTEAELDERMRNAESAERYVGRVTAGKSCRSRRFYFRIFKIDFLPMRRYWFSCVHSLFFRGLSFKGEGAASSIGKESSMIRNSGHPILH